MSAAAHDLVRALHAAYNDHDARAAAALYAADGRHREIATGMERTGPAAIGEGLGTLLAAFPDARWEARIRVGEGERAAVTYVLTGTLRARFGPFEPSDQRLVLPGAHVVVAHDELIALCEDYWDASTFGRQMRPTA